MARKPAPLVNNPALYDREAAPARWIAPRDGRYFRDRPRALWRVRPLLDGESPAVAELVRQEGGRAYAVVIDHRRAKDKRRDLGRVVYAVWAPPHVPKKQAREMAEAEARKLVEHFARTDASPAAGAPG
ncbi:MAG: hypothetical protein ACQEUZ_04360 [Pseudomonadota bacterium]